MLKLFREAAEALHSTQRRCRAACMIRTCCSAYTGHTLLLCVSFGGDICQQGLMTTCALRPARNLDLGTRNSEPKPHRILNSGGRCSSVIRLVDPLSPLRACIAVEI